MSHDNLETSSADTEDENNAYMRYIEEIAPELLRSFELEKEEDRASALIRAADLEEYLEILLSSFVVNGPKTREHLFADSPAALLGTFAAKTKMAYYLGLISEDERHDLDVIRSIRNKFAHGKRGMSFEVEPIPGLCSSLRLAATVPDTPWVVSKSRNRFERAASAVGFALIRRYAAAIPQQRNVPPEHHRQQ